MKKDKNKVVYKLFKYYESVDIIFDIALESLQFIGWLEKRSEYKSGITNKMKVSTKSIHGKINEFIDKELIEIDINIKGVGVQTIGFKFESKKNTTTLEMAMKIIFDENNFSDKEIKNHYTHLKNAFRKNVIDIDGLIRDNLEKKGYKSYY